MSAAIGLTKILNNLEECVKIIETIKENNDIVISLHEELEQITNYRKKIIEILQDESIDLSYKVLHSAIESNKDLSDIARILDMKTKPIIEAKKFFLDHISPVYDNSTGRIKSLSGEERINWFKSWELEDERFNTFKGIITSYCNWEYPVMEIFPGTGYMLPHALSGEPLYIVDWDEQILSVCSERFNEFYATKRLMKYKIEDYNLSELPQNSFGFIYSITQSSIETLEYLLDLAKNVKNCLLPGGVFLLAYNNSNYWWAVENTINFGFGSIDKDELENELKNIGFEIVNHTHDRDLRGSYIILKTPGEIEYIKNSSILANIIDKPEDLK